MIWNIFSDCWWLFLVKFAKSHVVFLKVRTSYINFTWQFESYAANWQLKCWATITCFFSRGGPSTFFRLAFLRIFFYESRNGILPIFHVEFNFLSHTESEGKRRTSDKLFTLFFELSHLIPDSESNQTWVRRWVASFSWPLIQDDPQMAVELGYPPDTSQADQISNILNAYNFMHTINDTSPNRLIDSLLIDGMTLLSPFLWYAGLVL